MTHRPPTPVEPALPGTAGRRQTSASGSPGDGEGAGLRAVADCSPSTCGRVWLKYVIAAAVPRIARIAAPATTFQISPKDTHPIRRRGARGSRQGTAGATSGAGTATSSVSERVRAGTATRAITPAAPTTAAAGRNIAHAPNASLISTPLPEPTTGATPNTTDFI